MRKRGVGTVAVLALCRAAAADAPLPELPRFRVGAEAMVTVGGDSTGGQLGITGDARIVEPLVVRARIGYGRLTPNYEQPDPSETVTILRFELGVELRKRHEMHAFFVGGHGGVQRMSDGWIRMNRSSIPWAALFGGQFGFEVYRGQWTFRGAFDISHWQFVDASGTEYSPIVELGYGF